MGSPTIKGESVIPVGRLFGLVWLTAAALLACSSSNQAPQAAGAPPLVTSARFAFVANRDANTISVFNVDQTTGELSGSATAATGACDGPVYLELSTHDTLFVACNFSNSVASFAVDPLTGGLSMIGSPVPTGAVPYDLTLDPTEKFLLVSNAGSNTLGVYSVSSTGMLAAVAG